MEYLNGNVKTTIYLDGTLIREFKGEPEPDHPDGIDVKITDYCNMGCVYCHEMSTTVGRHANIDKLLEVLSVLPAGVEIAIGGGNPLDHPELKRFLIALKDQGLIANITVNQGHLMTYYKQLRELIKQDLVRHIGISIINKNYKYINRLLKLTKNIVFHVIIGVNKPKDITSLISNTGHNKVLILGYKEYGFGKDYSFHLNKEIRSWQVLMMFLSRIAHCSFDNLAIKQLDIQQFISNERWSQTYMGDDGQFTMYVDGVRQQYAVSSTSNRRVSFNSTTLIDFFHDIKNHNTTV